MPKKCKRGSCSLLAKNNAARQLCRKARIDPYENYEIPNDLNFKLHEDFKISFKNYSFILYDNYAPDIDNSNRMMIFATEKNLQLLSENRRWLCDGTFDSDEKYMVVF